MRTWSGYGALPTGFILPRDVVFFTTFTPLKWSIRADSNCDQAPIKCRPYPWTTDQWRGWGGSNTRPRSGAPVRYLYATPALKNYLLSCDFLNFSSWDGGIGRLPSNTLSLT